MPIGKGRRPAPPGYMSAARAGEMLGISRIYKLIKADRLHRFTPPGQKHGYYSEQEVEQILEADKAFFEEKLHKIPAKFVQMKPSDTQSLYELATRIFGPGTISVEKRRALIEREARGNYILKREGSTEVIGYFYLQSLSHERIMQYFKDCRGSTIAPDEIRKIEPGQHEMIIAGIGRDPRADRQYVAVLLHGFKQEIEKWGHEGIDITKFYAYSETIDGVFLCFSMGMELYERPRYIGGSPHFKFVIDVATSNIPLLQGYKKALQEYRVSQGQETPMIATPIITTPQRDKAPRTPREPREERTTSTRDFNHIVVEAQPENTVSLQDVIKDLGINRSTLLTRLKTNGIQHYAVQKPNRPQEYERFFTPEQVAWIKTYSKAQPSLFD